MITDLDRSYYIGASDTKMVMGKWTSKTFWDWWNIKKGLEETTVDNIYTRAGSMWEGKILDYLNIPERDKQIIIGRLRVNLDGNDETTIYEIKTFKNDNGFKLPKHYWQQAQVEMYAFNYEICLVVAYGLEEEDYMEVTEVDEERLHFFPIRRNDEWIENEYLPRANYLIDCLEWGKEPSEEEYESSFNKH